MRKQRKYEGADERNERMIIEAENKRQASEAADAAVERMIRRSIEQYGA